MPPDSSGLVGGVPRKCRKARAARSNGRAGLGTDCGSFGADPADVVAVEDEHLVGQWLAAAAFAVGGIPAGKHGHVAIAHQWPPSLQVANDIRAAPGREGQVTRRRGAAQWTRLALVEIRVTVDVKHAIAPAPPQRQHRAEQQRAITTEQSPPSTTGNSPLPTIAPTPSASDTE
jgi:hypothetical protein